jgi:hypothetical protein
VPNRTTLQPESPPFVISSHLIFPQSRLAPPPQKKKKRSLRSYAIVGWLLLLLLLPLLLQGPHFGRLAQPRYAESLAWLKDNIEGRRIKCELLRRDQYNRVVALPLLPRTFRPWRHCRWWPTRPQGGGGTTTTPTRNLPLEMVRAGWGVVYRQTGAEYGSDWNKETYLAAEAEAKSVPFSSLFLFSPICSLSLFVGFASY